MPNEADRIIAGKKEKSAQKLGSNFGQISQKYKLSKIISNALIREKFEIPINAVSLW